LAPETTNVDVTGVPEARLKESSKPGKLELLKVKLVV
jgi:hypothetical protein